MTGLEPATSWSLTRCATNCATSRYDSLWGCKDKDYFPIIKGIFCHYLCIVTFWLRYLPDLHRAAIIVLPLLRWQLLRNCRFSFFCLPLIRAEDNVIGLRVA